MLLEHRIHKGHEPKAHSGKSLIALALSYTNRADRLDDLQAQINLLAELLGALLDRSDLTDQEKLELTGLYNYELVHPVKDAAETKKRKPK